MRFLDQDVAALGLGCWPIGGAMFSGEQSMGYANANDTESIRTIHAALASGITLFDTAAAYGAGHSERLLAKALKGKSDALVVTKIGIGIDERSKQLAFGGFSRSDVLPAIERCISRLERDRIDLLLLHLNELPVPEAAPIFDEMEKAVQAGKVRAYGWSTDFSQSAAAMADRKHFVAVEHAMNLFFDASRMQTVVHDNGLTALIRSPLAMGLLTGKYGVETVMPKNDIRAARETWMEYFKEGRANPDLLRKLDTARDLLTTRGRSLVQGAICWLWAKNPINMPIPGARTVEQIEDIAGALAYGPLPDDVMARIEASIEREPANTPDRPR